MIRGSQRGVESERERETESEHAQRLSEWERCRVQTPLQRPPGVRGHIWVDGQMSVRPRGMQYVKVLHVCAILTHGLVLHILRNCNTAVLQFLSIAVSQKNPVLHRYPRIRPHPCVARLHSSLGRTSTFGDDHDCDILLMACCILPVETVLSSLILVLAKKKCGKRKKGYFRSFGESFKS